MDLALPPAAAAVGVSEVSRQAPAPADGPVGLRPGVVPARVRLARVPGLDLLAVGERVADVPWQALAHHVVVDHEALGVLPAGARAGVLAPVLDAGQVGRALGVHGALRSAGEKDRVVVFFLAFFYM